MSLADVRGASVHLDALITQPDKISATTRQKLGLLINKYLDKQKAGAS